MTPSRLKFETVEQTQKEASMALTEFTKRAEQMTPFRQPQPQAPPPNADLVHELADGLDYLIQQLAAAEGDRDAARTQSRSMNQVVAEQQKALLQSMQLMRRLEIEVEDLRSRVDSISQAPAEAAPAEEVHGIPEDLVAGLEAKIGDLEAALATKDAEITTLRTEHAEQLIEQARKAKEAAALDPQAALRVLEDQRDQARNDAASARADLAIQSADLQTKETLIEALEQALEQQHASLRGLEEKFAAYAAKLEELRLDRLHSLDPKDAGEDASETAVDAGNSPGFLKRLFSRPKREEPAAAAGESEA